MKKLTRITLMSIILATAIAVAYSPFILMQLTLR